MSKIRFVLGMALFGVALNAYAGDPACAKMKSWAKVEGYRYKATIKSLPVEEDDHSENEGTIIICNAAGDIEWTATHSSEYIEFSVEAPEDFTGDKKKDLIVHVSMGAAYMYGVDYILKATPDGLIESGSFMISMVDGDYHWEDIDNDKIQEVIYDRSTITSRNFIPEIYAFGPGGSLDLVDLSSYPKYVKESLEALYETCSSGESFDGCAEGETAFRLALSGDSMEFDPISALESSFNHALFVGWTEDSAEFGYCAPVDAKPSASRCEFASEKKARSLTDYVKGAVLADKTKEIEAEAAKKRVNNISTFTTITDLKPVWKITTGKKGPVFSIGAQRPGNQIAYLHSIGVDLKKEGLNAKFTTAHMDGISMSPDGKSVGVLVHFTDGAKHIYKLKVLSVNKIASNAYNIAGLEHHKQERFQFSAPLFAKAYEFDKEAKWPAFNLACAHARLYDEDETRKALEIVIAQKNKDIIKKIATDPDLEFVRNKAWFSKLVAP
jgi:hypothetical protein